MRFNGKKLVGILIILFIVLCVLSYKVSWVIYIVYPLIITLMLFGFALDIISFKKVYYTKEKKLSIKVSYYRYIYNIFYILLLVLNLNAIGEKQKSIFIIFIIFLIIDLPIEYIKNSKIHFLKNGVCIYGYRFNQNIIPYSEIEKLKFIEYLKGKILLDIQLEKSVGTRDNQYKIKEKDKEDILFFVNDFIDREKIIETKEYKEDSLW